MKISTNRKMDWGANSWNTPSMVVYENSGNHDVVMLGNDVSPKRHLSFKKQLQIDQSSHFSNQLKNA